MRSRPFLIALAAHIVLLLCVMPASPWEFDEPLFFQALHKYAPLAHHPPPPGYPVFIHVGQLLRWLIPSDFATLLVISLIASTAGFALLALAFQNLTGEQSTGLAGAMFFYWSPALLIHSTLPISEPGALALLAATLYFGGEQKLLSVPLQRMVSALHVLVPPAPDAGAGDTASAAGAVRSATFSLFAALTVGWRMQYAIFVVPLFLVTVAMMRTWRDRVIALGVFTIVCLIWLTPLANAAGSVDELIAYEARQGKYVAAHDAAESRTGWTPARIAFRFIGRAWGLEWMALIVLGLAAYGFFLTVRKRGSAVWPLIVAAVVYIGFALWTMDPADGVRYSIPFVLTTALFAGAGVRRAPYVIAVMATVVFLIYASPLLVQRRFSPSPPIQAAHYARAASSPNAVILYELPLWPHATYYLGDRNPHRVDAGLAKFWNRPEVPLFIYADGATPRPDAKVFRWKASDAYIKLTRNHYRATSIIPMPPERRFRVVGGVYAPERDQDGREWRWLDSAATVQLPDGPARSLALRIGLPNASAVETNTVSIFVNDVAAAKARVERGRATTVTVDIPHGAPLIKLTAERSFVPSEIPSMRSGDRRRLALELYDLRTAPPTGR